MNGLKYQQNYTYQTRRKMLLYIHVLYNKASNIRGGADQVTKVLKLTVSQTKDNLLWWIE